MRKLIMVVFIICFVGSASAAEVTYHFTAEMNDYPNDAEIFSSMGYSADMPLKGTITIDPEIEGMMDGDPYGPNGWGFWTTGVIRFENQGYDWLDSCGRYIFIQNAVTDHEIKILTKQGDPNNNPDDPEMMQVITLTYDGLDANMPSDFDLGNSPIFTFQITKAGVISIFDANIIEIMNEEEYVNSIAMRAKTEPTPEQFIGDMCSCDDNWKNHGAYVSCVAKAAGGLVKKGSISKKKKRAIVSEAAKTRCGKEEKHKKKNKK